MSILGPKIAMLPSDASNARTFMHIDDKVGRDILVFVEVGESIFRFACRIGSRLRLCADTNKYHYIKIILYDIY
jgi:hypothetical protein